MPYARGDTHHKQALDIWPVLTAHVIKNTRKPLHYRDLANAIGRDDAERQRLTTALDIIGEYCRIGGLPALNAIVVNSDTGLPLSGFHPAFDIKREQDYVYDFDWESEPRPALIALANLGREHA